MTKSIFPRWRGFHLLDMFEPTSKGDWNEDDYCWIRELGFDFVSLPVCFTLWVEDKDPYRLLEPGLRRLDRGVRLGLQHGLHVCVNLHTAPGYDVNNFVKFPYSLWKDREATEAFCFQWKTLAERYADVPADQLSFHLINEPPNLGDAMTMEDHERVMRAGGCPVHS